MKQTRIFNLTCEYSSSSRLQQTETKALTTTTESTPIRKVKIEERRKHHHFRSFRHSSSNRTVSFDGDIVSNRIGPVVAMVSADSVRPW